MTRLPRQLENLARMLTYMLCHRPDEFGLVPDADGFVSLKRLLQTLTAEPGWGFVRRHHLEQVVDLALSGSFEVAGERIRCLVPGAAQLRRPEEKPPPLLYLAIPPKAHAQVWEQGLKPPPGRELVLARTREAALKLGRRRAPQPVMVIIQAQAAAKKGITFQGYGEELFLASALPREFLQLPAPPAPEVKPPAAKPAAAPPTPGSFLVDLGQPSQKPPPRRGKKAEPAWKAGTRALRRRRGKDLGEKGEKGKNRK